MDVPSPESEDAGQAIATLSECRRKIRLVDPVKLCEIIESLKLTPMQEKSMKDRWLRYVLWWDSRASRAKWKYHLLRGAVVIGSLAVPVLLALSQMKQLANYTWPLTVASISASFIVAVCAGLESLFGFGDIWREKRDACELIKSEGYSFFQQSGSYEDQGYQKVYPQFASNVEKLIRSEIKEYLNAAKNRQKNAAVPAEHGQRTSGPLPDDRDR